GIYGGRLGGMRVSDAYRPISESAAFGSSIRSADRIRACADFWYSYCRRLSHPGSSRSRRPNMFSELGLARPLPPIRSHGSKRRHITSHLEGGGPLARRVRPGV